MAAEVDDSVPVEALTLDDDGTFPNNVTHPALLYRRVLHFGPTQEPGCAVAATFARHGWTNGWRDGVYNYHHYHSTAHEVLGCYSGRARLQLGGPSGPEVNLEQGDVLVVPAGVSHRRLDASPDFRVVGCYAGGRDYDLNTGKPGERPNADRNIAAVAKPEADPVLGRGGPLLRYWQS